MNLLNEYYATIYYRDVIERYTIKDKKLIESFMIYILSTYSSILTINQLEKQLTKTGNKISKMILGRYLSYFKEAFFTLECPKF
jgi:predicted AAA+ superfamily ATPase